MTHLKVGNIILLSGIQYQVTMVNECRAVITPVTKREVKIGEVKFQVTGVPLSISPQSEVEII